MKKRILFVLAVTIVGAFLLMSATATAGSGVSLDDVSFSYEGMSTERAERIVSAMFGVSDDDYISERSILCIFGHNLSFGTMITIHHRLYAAAPRCRETVSFIEYCTRNSCNYFRVTGESTTRRFCCP